MLDNRRYGNQWHIFCAGKGYALLIADPKLSSSGGNHGISTHIRWLDNLHIKTFLCIIPFSNATYTPVWLVFGVQSSTKVTFCDPPQPAETTINISKLITAKYILPFHTIFLHLICLCKPSVQPIPQLYRTRLSRTIINTSAKSAPVLEALHGSRHKDTKPFCAPTHSARTAPTIPYVAAILRPEKKYGRACGIRDILKIFQRLAPITFKRSSIPLSTSRAPGQRSQLWGKANHEDHNDLRQYSKAEPEYEQGCQNKQGTV